MTQQRVLEAEAVSVRFGQRNILHEVSFRLEPGTVLCLRGLNGSGKSTLLAAIAADVPISAGSIRYGNVPICYGSTHTLRQMGVIWVPQKGLVYSTLTVEEHFRLALYGSRKRHKKMLMAEMLRRFPLLESLLARRGGNLSGGERNQLSIAMLWFLEGRCWLLDEPLAGLSDEAEQNVVAMLQEAKERTGTSIILVEHRLSFIHDLVDTFLDISNYSETIHQQTA